MRVRAPMDFIWKTFQCVSRIVSISHVDMMEYFMVSTGSYARYAKRLGCSNYGYHDGGMFIIKSEY